MAAAFGIWELRLPSSRAVDDEEDDENEITEEKESNLTPSTIWSTETANFLTKNSLKKLVCSSLFVAIGEVASTFLEAYYLCGGNSDVIGVITDKHGINDFETAVCNVENKVCMVHKLSGSMDNIVLQCKGHVDEMSVFYWTKKIFDSIEPSKVIILTSRPVCDYMTSDPQQLPADFLRMLCTSKWKDDTRSCDYLETPNTVAGLAASVLSHCAVHTIPSVLYIGYTATRQIDVQAVKVFCKLHQSKDFCCLKQSSHKETTTVLKSLGIGKSSYEHLYL